MPTDTLPASSKPRLLIVQDDEEIRTQMKRALSQDYEVYLAENREIALSLVQTHKPQVIVLDLGLPPGPAGGDEGFTAFDEILNLDAPIKVIIITSRGEREGALRAMGQGAYDFFYKPVDIEELKIILKRASFLPEMEKECQELERQFGEGSFEGMLGKSPKMQEVFSAIRKVAIVDIPVLITGESGTGKELVARAIHQLSHRRQGPFVVINCSAIPETLLESELFGHEKGAFTGAHIQRKGRVELAQNGTLFLDEIADLSLPLQAKLLRFLQEQVIERIGGRKQIRVDTRVLVATNRDLKDEIKKGNFREDLYYRLGVITISLPPLRERNGDILLLANAFLERYARENKKGIKRFTEKAIYSLQKFPWPGNVRELENRIKRAAIMADGRKVKPEDLELTSSLAKYQGCALKEAREALERDLIQRSLIENKGNLTRVAVELGISRPSLYDLMEKLGIPKRK